MQNFLSSITELSPLEGQKVLVVIGNASYKSSGANDVLEPLLKTNEYKQYSVMQSNPELKEIDQVVSTCRSFSPDIIIAIGGGSVMDVAKAARFLASQKDDARAVLVDGGGDAAVPSPRLIAVPTTAGSGAESTHFAVVYDNGIKYSLAHEFVRPNVVVLDERLIKSMPKKVAAASSMDAMAQAIESHWSVQSTDESRQLSLAALRLILTNIEPSIHAPSAKTRKAMLEGANLAGRAIDQAFTTAPHALSYAFTVRFGMSHGEAVSLTLPDFIRFNAAIGREDCNDKRGIGFVQQRFEELLEAFDQPDSEGMARRVEELRASIGLTSSIRTERASDAVKNIAQSVNQQRLKNNPRVVTDSDITGIVQKIFLK